jgi:hypothetical protein
VIVPNVLQDTTAMMAMIAIPARLVNMPTELEIQTATLLRQAIMFQQLKQVLRQLVVQVKRAFFFLSLVHHIEVPPSSNILVLIVLVGMN